MARKTGVIEAAIDSMSKMETLKELSEDLVVEQEVTEVPVQVDSTDIEVVATQKAKTVVSEEKEAVKTLSVILPVSDFKRLRVIALSNDRTIKDEVVSMIRERYKEALKAMMTPIE